MAASAETDLAAKLLERLLSDPAFRAQFRRDPAAACRAAGLDGLAQEMSVGGGKAMMTLDIRESKSSLAGVMMAAAMEGVAIYQFAENILPHLEEIPGQIADVLSRVDLPAIPDALKKPVPGGNAAPPAAAPAADSALTGGVEPGVSASSPAAAAATAPPPAATPAAAEAATGKSGAAADAAKEAATEKPAKAADGAAGKDAASKPEGKDEAQEAAKKIAEENKPPDPKAEAEKTAGAELDERASGVPDSTDLPVGGTAPAGAATPPANALPTTDAPPAAPVPPANALPTTEPAPPANALPTNGATAPPADNTLPDKPTSGIAASDAVADKPKAAGVAEAVASQPKQRAPVDPAQFGAEGTGGAPDPEALALLKNKNIVLDADGIKDIKAGRIDPRVVAVLTKLSEEHKITVTCMCSDHDQFTAGGSVSNHHLGRGMDIGRIDGEIVGPGSPLARDVASELSTLNADYRPNEIGSPFAIAGAGYFTDAAHQNHLHIGFKEAITPDWKPPTDVAADAETVATAPAEPAAAVPVTPAPAVTPAAAAPVTPAPVTPTPAPQAAAVADPPPKLRKESQLFMKAVTAKDAAAEAKKASSNPSLAFMKAVEPPKPEAPAPGAPIDLAAVAAAAPDTYPGDNAPREQIAAWMAGQAEKRGLPPELPLMASLVESGMKNLNFGDADSVGFFQMRVGIWNQGEYAGYPDKPELQVKWFLDTAERVKAQRVAAGKSITDSNQFGDWIADVEQPAAQYRGRYQLKLGEAQDLLKQRPAVAAAQPVVQAGAVAEAAAAVPGGGGGSSLGAAALQIAETQKGVREVGTNSGPQVDQYLAAAKVAPGNPWCASFITWAMEKAGHKMPGGGWAAVQTWVRNAEQGSNGLKIVSAEDARPGDIVAYDWGGQNDFGADGHIGFLQSDVKGGQFTALEGNNADKVNVVPRQVGGGAKVVFIRAEGNASPGAGAPAVEAAASTPSAPSAPLDAAQFGADGAGGAPSPEALALLENKNVILDADGIKDIKAGRIDPRVVGVLTKLSQEHKITVTCMCSDHSKFTAGGSVSNHHLGRGMDIGAIDGEIVGPGSPLARQVASELSSFNQDIRPNEIGSPFAIAGAGYFTDAAHQNHLHIGFKDPIAADWKPPADVATAAPVASAAAVVPGTPAAAPPLELRKSSQLFMKAVTAKEAAADAKRAAGSASQLFMKAVEPPKVQEAQPAPVASAAAAPVDVAAVAAAAPDAYPGDSAPREQIAAWMAGQAEKRGLPPQLPLMASLVESGMKNLNFGDADSVGFFQMRVGIWNQGAYAGYPDKPELQVKWFLDQAEAVKRQRIVAGKSTTDPNQFGEWIADVERPAAQYRGRYQLKLDEANSLLKSAPAQPAAAPVAAAAPVDPAAAAAGAAALGDAKLPAEILAPIQEAMAAGNGPGPKALAAIEEASKYLGTDYKWGGSTPQTGFDCSGLMQWSYAQSGVQIPRVTYTQIEAPNGTEIADRGSLKPGDLVFFSNAGDVHHVGMFLGGDKFLHAPRTGDVVKVSSLSEPYYAQQFAGGRRFDNAAQAVATPAAAPAVAPAAAAPAIDPTDVAKAQAAVARDAAEVRRNESQLFQAVKKAEDAKDREFRRSALFMKAIDPSQVKRPGATAAAAPPAATPPATPPPVETPATPAPVEPAATTPAADPAIKGPGVAPAEPVGNVSIDLTNAATDYPGNNASQAELAQWLAKHAQKAGLPPELPVMASLVESGVKNLNFGDADSVGFFQMRVGIWNQGAYQGYPEKPELQVKWFIDQALALKRKRIAAGDADFGQDPAKWGEWIADVERPAEQFRGRYQLRLDEARKLLT